MVVCAIKIDSFRYDSIIDFGGLKGGQITNAVQILCKMLKRPLKEKR